MKKTLVKLLARFIGHKGIKFDGSRVYYWNVPMIVIPMSVLSYLQHELEQNFGSDSRKIVYSLGKLQGRNGTNILIEKFKIIPDESDLSFFMEQTEFVGVGKIKLMRADIKKGYMLINSISSPNAKAYVTLYGHIDWPVCDYVRGLFTGAVEAIYKATTGKNDTLNGIETECMGQGKSSCLIEIRRDSDWNSGESRIRDNLPLQDPNLKHLREKETLKMLLKTPPVALSSPVTELSRIIKRNHDDFQLRYEPGGVVSVFGVPCLVTPMDIAVILYESCRTRFGDKSSAVFYKAGENLGKLSTQKFISLLNVQPNNIRHVHMAFEQAGLYGLGKAIVVRGDINSGVFHIKCENCPGTHYFRLFGATKHRPDVLLSGFFSGVASSLFNNEFSTREERCVANGARECIFRCNPMS